MKLTEHFSLHEFDKYGDTEPREIEALRHLCKQLEKLRSELNMRYGTDDLEIKITITPRGGYHGDGMDASGHKRGKKSQHRIWKRIRGSLFAAAADMTFSGGVTPLQAGKVMWDLIDVGAVQEGGLGVYSSFLHYDTRGTKARWPRFGAWRKD